MPTTDESSHSAKNMLHPHHTEIWPPTPNDIISVHTLNCCDSFCTINWSKLLYGHFDPKTLLFHDAYLGFSCFHWLQAGRLRMTSWCLLYKNSNSVCTCHLLLVDQCLLFVKVRNMKSLLHFCRFLVNCNCDIENDYNLWKTNEQTFPTMYCLYRNIVNFPHTSQIHLC